MPASPQLPSRRSTWPRESMPAATWRRCLDSPRLFLPFRTDIGALMYVWSTQTSPESTVFPAFSGILCIFRFHRRAVCSDTCAWCAACLRVAPSESMETSFRIWEGFSLDEQRIVRVLPEKVLPQSRHAHLWCPCSFPYFFRRCPWQYGHSPKKVLDLLRRSKTWSLKRIRMILSGSSGTSHRRKLLYQPVAGLGTPLI